MVMPDDETPPKNGVTSQSIPGIQGQPVNAHFDFENLSHDPQYARPGDFYFSFIVAGFIDPGLLDARDVRLARDVYWNGAAVNLAANMGGLGPGVLEPPRQPIPQELRALIRPNIPRIPFLRTRLNLLSTNGQGRVSILGNGGRIRCAYPAPEGSKCNQDILVLNTPATHIIRNGVNFRPVTYDVLTGMEGTARERVLESVLQARSRRRRNRVRRATPHPLRQQNN